MKNKVFIISSLICVIVFVVVFAWQDREFSKNKISEKTLVVAKNAKSNSEIVALEGDYQKDAKRIFTDFYSKDESGSLDLNSVRKCKNDFLSLKVTERFKEVHLQIAIAMIKMEKFFITGSSGDQIDSKKITAEIKKNNPWLN